MHKTLSENRPEPWFEIDAETLIKTANDINLTSLQINCIRCEKCDECVLQNLKKTNVEEYIRIKLGKSRIKTDARSPTQCYLNKQIIELFKDDFNNKHVVLLTHNGAVKVYIISNKSYIKYDYWKHVCIIAGEDDYYRTDMLHGLPYEKNLEFDMRYGYENTDTDVEVIKKIIRYCEDTYKEKQENICKLKIQISNLNDILRKIRNRKNYQDYILDCKKDLLYELNFIENDINYIRYTHDLRITYEYDDVKYIEIIHSVTRTHIAINLLNNRTLYKSKWRNDISANLIIAWYNSKDDIIDEL